MIRTVRCALRVVTALVVILQFGAAFCYSQSDDPSEQIRRGLERRFGGSGDVRSFPKDPQLQEERAAEMRRYLEQRARQEQEYEEAPRSTSYSSRNYSEALRSASRTGTGSNFIMAFFGRLVVALAFLVVVGSLARSTLVGDSDPRVRAFRQALARVTRWPTKFDCLMMIGSIAVCYTLLWQIPYSGPTALIFFFGLVVPLSAFVLTWQFLAFLERNELHIADAYKQLAVSSTAALILLQFGFEPWGYVLVKLVVLLAITPFFLRNSSLLSYRVFLVPAVFALLFSVMRLFGPEPTSYVFARLGLNVAIIFLTVRSFMKASGNVAESLFPERSQIVEACRTLIGMGSHQRSSAPPNPPKRWFLFLDGVVTGPVLEPELLHGAAEGKWSPDTPVCKEGSNDWQRLETTATSLG